MPLDDGLNFNGGYVIPPTVPPDPEGRDWRGEPGPPGPGGTGPTGPQGPPGGGGVTVSTTPPPLIAETTWWDPASAQLYVAYDDGTSIQWVPAASNIAGLGVFASDTAPDPTLWTEWFNTNELQLYISYNDGSSSQWVPCAAIIPGNWLDINTGGTLAGPLILAADPTGTLEAATKAYVDAHGGAGAFTGGTLTSPLILAGNPAVALGAATKQYVDAADTTLTTAAAAAQTTANTAVTNAATAQTGAGIANSAAISAQVTANAALARAGGTMTGAIILAADPTVPLGAATKQYVDASPAGTVTSVVAGSGLSGGTITATGTVALATIATGDVLANTSGSTAVPVATTVSALIDNAIGSVQGDVLYRSASAWSVLAPGTSGQVLKTGGAAANPAWANSLWNAGTVTTVGTGLTLSSGTITASGGVPVITTLLSPNPASGNLTANGTEQTIASSTSLSVGATFQPVIDLTNLADGDIVIVKTYRQANSSSSLVEESAVSFSNAQSDLVPDLKKTNCTAGLGYKATVQQTAGTNRTFQWAVQNEAGT